MPHESHYQSTDPILPVSVITTCYGRNQHLYNLLASLQIGTKQPAEVIIVNDDADINKLNSFNLNIVQVPTTLAENDPENELSEGFDIGRNRNLGAIRASYDTLVFIDVDCIVATDFIAGLTDKIKQHPHALIMGQPRYLIRPLTNIESQRLSNTNYPQNDNHTKDSKDDKQSASSSSWLDNLSVLNPYRHNLVSENPQQSQAEYSQKIEQTEDYGAFWSLCFAICKAQFERIGGFDTRYVGYGAEDTDFAFTARKLGIEFYLTDDVVYHQQHCVYRPPLNHLDSIVVNANIFYDKWQHWPMSGWLEAFTDMDLIQWHKEQVKPIEILRQPTNHEIENAHCPDAPFV